MLPEDDLDDVMVDEGDDADGGRTIQPPISRPSPPRGAPAPLPADSDPEEDGCSLEEATRPRRPLDPPVRAPRRPVSEPGPPTSAGPTERCGRRRDDVSEAGGSSMSFAETNAQATPPDKPPRGPPAAPAGAPPTQEEQMERQNLLRQLDLLRLKFKQSIIPTDIEQQHLPVVKMVVERNLAQLKRARNVAMCPGRGCRQPRPAPTSWAWRPSWSSPSSSSCASSAST